MAVTGSMQSRLRFTQTPDAGFFAGLPFSIDLALNAALATSGTAADQVDGIYAKRLTFTAETPIDLDLQSLTDIFGASLSLAKVRMLAIRVRSTTNGATLTASPHETNGWTALIAGGSSLVIAASTADNAGAAIFAAPNTDGYAVGASNKVLTLTPSDHAFSVDVLIAGVKS